MSNESERQSFLWSRAGYSLSLIFLAKKTSNSARRRIFFMPKNNKKLYTGIFIFIIIFFIVIGYSRYAKEKKEIVESIITEQIIPAKARNDQTNKKPKTQVLNPITSSTSLLPKNNQTESATVLAGDAKVQLLFAPNTIFYDALVQARNQGQIVFDGKNYLGLGFFITDIGTLHSGAGTHLLYYINGKEAIVGVSLYTLKDGDIIEWKLE